MILCPPGSQPGEYQDLTGTWTGIYANGTIRFDEIRKLDEGQYLCEARNGVGSGLSKVISVKVNGKPVEVDSLIKPDFEEVSIVTVHILRALTQVIVPTTRCRFKM